MMKEENDKEVMKIAEDLTQLKGMFADVAEMVHTQGDHLNQVKTQTGDAVIYLEDGNNELLKAHSYVQSARKKKVFIALILLGVIAGIVCIILFYEGVIKK
eukprot:TRINITY_DN6485_c0_g1_i1.p2 TRINITY_DN6485_c0_g1~~TRINITY_DN6485_c0_g1_i1.p2  ORF type:complete len:101 (-),score=31.40 TRINITY_DN6485_c0_g1_i1:11-313(-)